MQVRFAVEGGVDLFCHEELAALRHCNAFKLVAALRGVQRRGWIDRVVTYNDDWASLTLAPMADQSRDVPFRLRVARASPKGRVIESDLHVDNDESFDDRFRSLRHVTNPSRRETTSTVA
jgi:hypothetical protein